MKAQNGEHAHLVLFSPSHYHCTYVRDPPFPDRAFNKAIAMLVSTAGRAEGALTGDSAKRAAAGITSNRHEADGTLRHRHSLISELAVNEVLLLHHSTLPFGAQRSHMTLHSAAKEQQAASSIVHAPRPTLTGARSISRYHSRSSQDFSQVSWELGDFT